MGAGWNTKYLVIIEFPEGDFPPWMTSRYSHICDSLEDAMEWVEVERSWLRRVNRDIKVVVERIEVTDRQFFGVGGEETTWR